MIGNLKLIFDFKCFLIFVLQVHHFVYISILHLDVVCHSINGLPIPKIEGKKIYMSYISIVTTKLQYLDV